MENQVAAERKPLLHSIVQYLHRHGFCKTLKRFLKEAQIEDDCWKTSSYDLEEMYCKYLDAWHEAQINSEAQKEQNPRKDGAQERKSVNNPREYISKAKKRKNSKEGGRVSGSPDLADLNPDTSKEAIHGSVCVLKKTDNLEDQEKKKKKTLPTSESCLGNEKQLTLLSEGMQETLEYLESQSFDKIVVGGTTEKKKNKKSKASELDTNSCLKDTVKEEVITNDQRASRTIEKRDIQIKDSKKRKRSESEDNDNHQVEGECIEESKRRKTKEVKEAKNDRKKGKSDAVTICNGHVVVGGKDHIGFIQKEEDKDQIFNDSIDHEKQGSKVSKRNSGNRLENSALEKSTQKQHNGLSEPRTLSAFQRVKADEVKFVDDRLRDNSYWAKSGADFGYGAKAQEVLGQVRGRDFRHEKTKKKRGSYRGGQIDLQSHSIKFNYPEDE
ncbi:unnamed protein product [Cuscuta europaea]|uniref:Srp40 C-terminal domain-containing protein n=1 Tax=Cuscuta europaea TaxID=41803 RepID=A0A9P0Z855_CUSEU|nr:unnamed protein product [Cuscuta europaea]